MAMGGCTPLVDWSLCEDTGFPRVLPAFYVVSAICFGVTGILYVVSTVRTLRTQFREKKRLTFNTAMQMHVGIVGFSVTAVCHDSAVVTREPGMPALPLLLLYHARLIFVAFVTTVLVRHWAVLYQQMGHNQPNQQQLTDKIARFVQLYRDGEVIEAVLTCSFFLGTVVYAVKNQESWENVERLQCLVWASVSGVTCWLVTVLGRLVHVNLQSVSRSRAMIAHVRRVYYVAIGSSVLWCQCTVCFALGAALDRPLSPAVWLAINCGINLTGVGVGFLYYLVIGPKVTATAARALAAELALGSGVRKLRQNYQKVAKLVSFGANTLRDGVTAISDQLLSDGARIHMGDDEEEFTRPWNRERQRSDTGGGGGESTDGGRLSDQVKVYQLDRSIRLEDIFDEETTGKTSTIMDFGRGVGGEEGTSSEHEGEVLETVIPPMATQQQQQQQLRKTAARGGSTEEDTARKSPREQVNQQKEEKRFGDRRKRERSEDDSVQVADDSSSPRILSPCDSPRYSSGRVSAEEEEDRVQSAGKPSDSGDNSDKAWAEEEHQRSDEDMNFETPSSGWPTPRSRSLSGSTGGSRASGTREEGSSMMDSVERISYSSRSS